MKFLKRKLNVVVVAGASGIGLEIVIAYLDEGCRLFVCDVSSEFLENINQKHPDVFTQRTNVAVYDEVKSFFDHIQSEVDHIDVLINCAGIAGPTGELQDLDPKAWDLTTAININGMFYCLKEAVPLIKKSDSPSIINLASNAAFFGFPLRSPYATAKWACIGLTKTLAMELGAEQVRVNAICPGSVRGERIDRVVAADAKAQNKSIEEIEKLYCKQVSMKTFVEASDVAHLALFLSSEYGRFISGQAIGLDGHTEGLSNS
ncbi:SDR family oxidoreductase [Reichenbachiella sp.]